MIKYRKAGRLKQHQIIALGKFFLFSTYIISIFAFRQPGTDPAHFVHVICSTSQEHVRINSLRS